MRSCTFILCCLLLSASAFAAEVSVDNLGRYRIEGNEKFGCDTRFGEPELLRFAESDAVPETVDINKFKGKQKKRIKFLKSKLLLQKLQGKPTSGLKKKIKKSKARLRFAVRCGKNTLPTAPAELFMDQYGTPNAEGSADESAFFAAGYAHASTRLFQMYFQSWKVQGRLAEFFGPKYGSASNELDLIGLDTEARYNGFARWTRAHLSDLDQETLKLLTAYSSGVNRYVSEFSSSLPHGFQQIGVTALEPWKPEDSIFAFLSLAQLFTGGGDELDSESKFEADVTSLGYQQAEYNWLHPILDADSAMINDLQSSQAVNTLGAHLFLTTKASHNFVVSGERNSTGKPLGVFLPMLQLQTRALMETHITSPTLNARGAAVPGMPGLLAGYTPFMAWGPSALATDGSDLFRLISDPAAPDTAYILDGVSTPYELVPEIVKVKGEADLAFTVRESFFGPVVTDQPGVFSEPPYAMRHVIRTEYAPHDPVDAFRGLLGMMRAKTLDQFRDIGLRYLPYPSMHLPYMSSEGEHGRIGYSPVLAMPVRSDAAPLLGIIPQDGSKKENDWVRILSFEERPSLTDPPSGFIVSGNNLPYVGPLYGYGGIGHTVRSDMLNYSLEQIFQQTPIASSADLINLRLTCKNRMPLLLRDLVHYLKDNYTVPTSRDIDGAITYLDQWGGTFSYSSEPYLPLILRLDSSATVRFRQTRMALEKYNGGEQGLMFFLRSFQKDPAATISPEYKDDIISWLFDVVLTESWQSTNKSPDDPADSGFGDDPERWSEYLKKNVKILWGTYFTLPSSLDPSANLVSNDLECPNAATIRSQSGNIYTQVNLMSDPDGSMTLSPPGIDDDPNSESFSNQFSDWENSEPHISPLTADNVHAGCSSTAENGKICGRREFTVAVSGKL